MKKIAFVFFALFAVSVANAQVSANAVTKEKEKNGQIHRYCAKLKDGVLVMMEDDHEMTMDVTLANGTQVKTDGSVTRTDGTVVILEEGECVDETGNISPAPGTKMKSKNQVGKKEDDMVPPGKQKK
jgi:ribosomal protein S4E